MSKHYETVELRILRFSVEDVIKTSGPFDNPYVEDFYGNGNENNNEGVFGNG